jgi:hypothetical protein
MRRSPVHVVAFIVFFLTAPAAAMNEWVLPLPDEPRARVGCEFPDFPLSDIDGNTVWFNDYKGRPLLVAFCSCYTDTVCAVIDSLERIRGSLDGDLFTIIVCSETAPALAEEGYRGLRSECSEAADLVLVDPQGETRRPFRVEVMPTVYLIDGDFCVRHRAVDVSGLNSPAFREQLQGMMEEFPAGR